MKTAGYDIAVLINERFLNQLAGALYYSGFLTVNGSVDLYNGTLMLEHQVQDFHKDLSQELQGQVSSDLQPFLKMDFRFKLTQEPMIDFIQEISGQRIRFALGMRIYFWLWQGLEVKFDASVSFSAPVSVDADFYLRADLAHAEVQELALKYGSGMENQMVESLDEIVEDALSMYFANNAIEKRLAIPTIGAVIPDVEDYIQSGTDAEGRTLPVIPVSVEAMRVVTPTVMALGINLMEYHGGDPNQLHDFARNCSLAVGVSEAAMHKVFSYVWTHSQFVKRFGSNGSMVLVKDYDSLSVAQSGTFRVKKLDDFFSDLEVIADFVTLSVSKGLTGGIIEADVDYKGMEFNYDLGVTLKNEPRFDLLGGNRVSLYNMAFRIALHLACYITIQYNVELDTSGWIPDSWTPWDDDITLYTETKRYKIFDLRILLDNLELRYGRGKLLWDEPTQTLELEVEKINLYWNFNNPDSPLHGLPGALINWITDQFEDEIVKRIPKIAVTPKLSFELPLIPWELKMTGRRLEITNSEAVVAADFGFEELEKSAYPVPKYIVNINNGEIHKIGCDSVTDTYEVHQRSYHLLSEALAHGYDGCRKCLPAFHTR
jgi:hypothetical protein